MQESNNINNTSNKIKYRNNEEVLIGQFFYDKNLSFVLTENQNKIFIKDKNINSAKHKQFVSVKLITQKLKNNRSYGSIIKILGNEDNINTADNISIQKFNLITDFSKKTILQSNKFKDIISADEIKNRIDLRHLKFITIDGDDAKDYDDAVYCEKIINNKFRLLVAIADVSHYVQEGKNIDLDALLRGTSVYLPNIVIPMLPNILSNNICSLLPNKDRLTVICDMTINNEGLIDNYKFYNSVIRSHARITYEEGWNLLKNNEISEISLKEFIPNIKNLFNLYKKLKKARLYRKSLDFDTFETKFIFKNNMINSIDLIKRNDIHKTIEECMLAANICAADFLIKNNSEALYRVHDKPTQDRLDNLNKFLTTININIEQNNISLHDFYFNLIDNTKTLKNSKIIQSMCLRSFQQARYSPTNIGHFGLSYDAYVHFTSPIRRYPDLVIHRLIKSIISIKGQFNKYENEKLVNYTVLGEIMSNKERVAEEASRYAESWLKCLFAKSYIGKTFNGLITNITNFGVFISLESIPIEGMIHVSCLGEEYFQFDQDSITLKGKNSGITFSISDKINVKISKVDLLLKKIYLLPTKINIKE